MPPRIPTEADFASCGLTVALHYPDPPAATRAFLLLLHGFGDSEAPFVGFARAMNLPGVLAVAVRGTSVLPAAMVGDTFQDASAAPAGGHFYWADDLQVHHGELDPDPPLDLARQRIADRLVDDVLVRRCGWRHDDVLLFGFGQGGTLALSVAAAASPERHYKAVISIGGGPSLCSPSPSPSASSPLPTPVLVCGPAAAEAVADDTLELLRQRFSSVTAARWARPADDNGMPRNRREMLPIMEFLAARLRDGAPYGYQMA